MVFRDNIEQYIDQQEHWRGELMYLRQIIKNVFPEENMKWNAPVYGKDGKNLIGIGAFKKYVGIWFFQGGLLKDNEKVLQNAQEGKTKAMRQWRFHGINEIIQNKETLIAYLRETLENHDNVKIIAKAKPRKKPLFIPELLQETLDENESLNQHFQKLSLSKRREYSDYILDAKRESTQLRRLQKIIPMILDGIGLNDKYKK